MDDAWQSGIAYERFMGRWSALIAQKFLDWLDAAPAGSWLDVGCGTGALTRLILENCQPKQITSIDPSADFIAHVRNSINDTTVHFKVGLAQALDLASNSMDAVVSGLVLNFVPQPELAVAEMLRVAKPGGKIGLFVWDYSAGMQMLRYFWDAAVELDPETADQIDPDAHGTLGVARLSVEQEALSPLLALGLGGVAVAKVAVEIEIAHLHGGRSVLDETLLLGHGQARQSTEQ